MSYNITRSKTADGKIVFAVGGQGQLQKFTLIDANNLNKIDQLTQSTVESSVLNYLKNNTEEAVSNPADVQATVTRIEQRASMGYDYTAKKEIPGTVDEISAANASTKTRLEPANPGGGAAGLQSPEVSAGLGGGSTTSSGSGNQGNRVFTFDDVKSQTLQQTSVGALSSTIGGADLSVFYMAEVPLMEDVLNGNASPDTWRTEIITIELDSVLSLSYSTIREKYPVRQLGKANPTAYTYGPRTIAGHLAFAIFTEDVLMRIRGRVRNEFLRASEKYKGALEERLSVLKSYYTAALELNTVQLLDSLIPFHLLVMGMNERGEFSKFIIKNVYIVDENQYQGTRHPNILNKVSYVAEDIVPMSYVNGAQTLTESMSSSAEGLELGAVSLEGRWPDLSGSALVKTIKDKDLIISHS